jgi:hypothetical protein
MTNRERWLPRAWRDTESTRRSIAWWTAAVLSGAALGVGGYYIAPDDNGLLWAFLGVVTGFFAPYALAVLWGMPLAALRDRSEQQARQAEWAAVKPVVRRTRTARRTTR